MKVVILAGGYGTRISEESELRPKPMVTIGGKPILWHIMKMYSFYGHNDFIICLGYKGNVVREYFKNLTLYSSDVTFDYTNGGSMHTLKHWSEPWKVSLIETGVDTMTGGRVKRIEPFIDDETFLLTYGDGVSDVNINQAIEFHQKSDTAVTVTAVRLKPRFGALDINESGVVTRFKEKDVLDENWINGGFMVADRTIFDYLNGDTDVLEGDPMSRMVADGKVSAFQHIGFWQPMDTLRERQELEGIWAAGNAPWKLWE